MDLIPRFNSIHKINTLKLSALMICLSSSLYASSVNAASHNDFAVGPQYDTTHVYVAPADFDTFVSSFLATFGGTVSKQGVFQVTPTPSQTI